MVHPNCPESPHVYPDAKVYTSQRSYNEDLQVVFMFCVIVDESLCPTEPSLKHRPCSKYTRGALVKQPRHQYRARYKVRVQHRTHEEAEANEDCRSPVPRPQTIVIRNAEPLRVSPSLSTEMVEETAATTDADQLCVSQSRLSGRWNKLQLGGNPTSNTFPCTGQAKQLNKVESGGKHTKFAFRNSGKPRRLKKLLETKTAPR